MRGPLYLDSDDISLLKRQRLAAVYQEEDQVRLKALLHAIRRQDYDFASFLIYECGAKVNIQNRLGIDPLAVAISTNNKAMVQLLLNAGAVFADVISDGWTRNCYGLYYTNLFVKSFLREIRNHIDAGRNLNIIVKQNITLLMIAISINSPESVKTLLENGASPNHRDNEGNTPLTVALAQSIRLIHYKTKEIKSLRVSKEVIQALIDGGADVNYHDSRGVTPLMVAVVNGRYQEVSMLLKAGANPNVEDANGDTAIIHAVKSRSIAMFDHLVAHDVDVKFKSSKGRTVWKIVRSRDYEEFIDSLLKAKFDFNQKNKKGETCLMQSIPFAPMVAKKLIEKGIDVNSANNKGITPLMKAVMHSRINLSLVKALIKAKANVNAVDEDGFTPLLNHLDACPDAECINTLIEAGANVNYLPDNQCHTPLTLAVRSTKNRIESVRTLINNGADPLIANDEGNAFRSAYGYARVFVVEDDSEHEVPVTFEEVLPIIHVLALENNKGQNRAKLQDFTPQQRKLLIKDRYLQLEKICLPYLSYYLMKKDSKINLEKFLDYKKGLEIIFDPRLPAELRRKILDECHAGPLSYSETEDSKARTACNIIIKKRYSP